MYEYRAIVRKIHDAATSTVDVDLGFGMWAHDQQLRFLGIQAPELSTKPGEDALFYLRAKLPIGCTVKVSTVKDRREKYGRMLAEVDLMLDGQPVLSVNKDMVDSGHAVAWDG